MHPKTRVFMHRKIGISMQAKEVVERWVKAFNDADADKISCCYADNAINHHVANDPIEGKIAIHAMFARAFATAAMHCITESIFHDGDWAILKWKNAIGLRGCGFFQIENGLIVFQRGYWDKLSFLKAHNEQEEVLLRQPIMKHQQRL